MWVKQMKNYKETIVRSIVKCLLLAKQPAPIYTLNFIIMATNLTGWSLFKLVKKYGFFCTVQRKFALET